MEWLWTWCGKCFGYRLGDELWTYDGKHAGRFIGSEVYGKTGQYLGEVMSGKRLMTDLRKTSQRVTAFTPQPRRVPQAKCADAADYTMVGSFGEFPSPDSFN
jgi:hypothetical protein